MPKRPLHAITADAHARPTADAHAAAPYTDNELRDALVAYKLPRAQGITVLSIVEQYGPSSSTLKRHGKRLQAACDMVKLAVDASKEQVRQVAAALEFPKGGRPTLFSPDEERMLLEVAALHAEHGVGKSRRLALSYGKRAASKITASEKTSAADAARLSAAKCAHGAGS